MSPDELVLYRAGVRMHAHAKTLTLDEVAEHINTGAVFTDAEKAARRRLTPAGAVPAFVLGWCDAERAEHLHILAG